MVKQPSPLEGHSSPPIVGPCLLWPNGLMDQDATWYGGIGLGPGGIVLYADPAFPSPLKKMGTAAPELFGP